VERVPDLLAIEASGAFHGRYHVLGGSLSPLDGVGPEQLRLAGLAERVRQEELNEVIVATNPTVDGEATALYVQRMLAPTGVRVTRLASGLPSGTDLEFLDRETISQALAGRRALG
jgi:recombination protein RecR